MTPPDPAARAEQGRNQESVNDEAEVDKAKVEDPS